MKVLSEVQVKHRSDKVVNWGVTLHWYVDSGPRLFSILAKTRVVVET